MKLVVTVNRLYLFDNPANETQATEYRMKKMHLSYMQQKKGFIPKEYYSVTGEPECNSPLTQLPSRLTGGNARWSPRRARRSETSS